ncbi:MAG: phosphate/phosphite/phosphonate ABC transporter substrate-binding protein, partial [Pseudohongiellaceae bacterium]
VVRAEQFISIYKSGSFPTTGYGVSHDLHPDVAAKVREAFFTFDWEGTALQREFADAAMEQFIPISYQEHWSVVRQIDEATNTVYNCD